jgi:hypothetical protein
MTATSITKNEQTEPCHLFKSVWLQHATHLMSLHMIWGAIEDKLDSLTAIPGIALPATKLADEALNLRNECAPRWMQRSFWLWFTPITLHTELRLSEVEALLVPQPVFFKDLPIGTRFEVCGFTEYTKFSKSYAWNDSTNDLCQIYEMCSCTPIVGDAE